MFICWFCGRKGLRAFRIWDGKPICESALACAKRVTAQHVGPFEQVDQ